MVVRFLAQAPLGVTNFEKACCAQSRWNLPKFTGILSRELICISLPIHIASSILHVKNENYWPGDTSTKFKFWSQSTCGANPGTASYRWQRCSLHFIFVRRWCKQNWLSRVPHLFPACGDERRCSLVMEKHLCRRASTVFISLKHRLCSVLFTITFGICVQVLVCVVCAWVWAVLHHAAIVQHSLCAFCCRIDCWAANGEGHICIWVIGT